MGKGGTIESDHLLGRKIGQQQRAGNQRPGQGSAGEEITVAGGVIVGRVNQKVSAATRPVKNKKEARIIALPR